MKKNEIISNLFSGKNFRDCINKMEPDHLREDLRQEVILIICELPEQKIIDLHSRKELEFFTVRVILNQIKSKTSPFAKKYRQYYAQYIEHEYQENRRTMFNEETGNRVNKMFSEDTALIHEERELREMIEDMAIEEVDKLYWYNKGLIELYVQHGNFRAIQKATGIPFGSVYKTCRKSFNEIKQKVS